jgi:glyoxylase-like metal-dependent hydrolase (beta-lactamase superfamily II)
VGIRERTGHDVRLGRGGEGVAAPGRERAVPVVVAVLSCIVGGGAVSGPLRPGPEDQVGAGAIAAQSDVSGTAPVLARRSSGMTGHWLDLADGVHARRYEELDLTVGLIVGTERCLVVDTRGDLEQGAELAAAVRQLTPLPWVVAYTHAHFDHAWGTERFAPCEVWAHEGCRAELTEHAEDARARWTSYYREQGKPEIADAIARTTVVPPDHTFTDRVNFDLGGRTAVLLHPGRAHTGHDAVVHVPDADVVFAGDVVEHAEHGFSAFSFSGESDLTAWPDALDRILALVPRVVVPGHGEPVGAEFVRHHRDGLRELIALKAAVGRGETTEAAAVAAARYPADVTSAALATP